MKILFSSPMVTKQNLLESGLTADFIAAERFSSAFSEFSAGDVYYDAFLARQFDSFSPVVRVTESYYTGDSRVFYGQTFCKVGGFEINAEAGKTRRVSIQFLSGSAISAANGGLFRITCGDYVFPSDEYSFKDDFRVSAGVIVANITPSVAGLQELSLYMENGFLPGGGSTTSPAVYNYKSLWLVE